MKKFLKGLLAVVLVLTLAGCKGNENNGDNGEGGDNNDKPKTYTMVELKEAATKAGYITNDYIACFTGLTEDQMEGFTVDIQKSETESLSYCVIVAKNEQYAKQACETVQSEFNTCLKSGSVVTFPETSASNDVLKMLKSIIEGKPIEPVKIETK